MIKKTLLLTLIFFGATKTIAPLNPATITNFVNSATHHDPKALPSSCYLFDTDKPLDLMWSILIPTLVERSQEFEILFTKLLRQIETENLQTKVEIVFFRDAREGDVGYKRNQLLANASGKYTCFVDDDDDVHEQYIAMIYQKLLEDCDCVKLVGIYHHIGFMKRKFIHSILYNSYFEKDQVYYRPPNHLNPIKRSISTQFKFPDQKNFGEDTDWAMQICKANVIKSEAIIEEPYYFYNFDPKKSVSWQKIQLLHKKSRVNKPKPKPQQKIKLSQIRN